MRLRAVKNGESDGFTGAVLGDCSSNNRYGIRVATLGAVKLSETVQRNRDIGMIGTKCLFFVSLVRACTTAPHRHNDLGLDIVPQDCSAQLRHRDDRDHAPFLESLARACTTAPHRHIDLGLDITPRDCSAKPRHRDDRDQVPFLRSLARACTTAPHRHIDLGLDIIPRDCSAHCATSG